jgi:hypothetical protein
MKGESIGLHGSSGSLTSLILHRMWVSVDLSEKKQNNRQRNFDAGERTPAGVQLQ